MSNQALIEMYKEVLQKIQAVNNNISLAEEKIREIKGNNREDIAARIKTLEDLLVKIDDYLPRIKGFQELAKKNLDSLNVLTIEAPPGYRVNLNRLRNWAMMIDPSSSNDPYAQRVYVVAKCDECFLEKKKAEFTQKIADLKSNSADSTAAEVEKLNEEIAALQGELKSYAMSEEVLDLSRSVVGENKKYWYETSPEKYEPGNMPLTELALGAYYAPLRFDNEEIRQLKNQFGAYLNTEDKRILLPAVLSAEKDFVISITCSPARRKVLDCGIQNMILNLVDKSPVGSQKVVVLDALRYNTSALGSLKQLEDSFVMEKIPRNPEQLTEALENIVAGFADIDDILELYDSVRDYNRQHPMEKAIPLTTVILYGWPNSFEGRNRELVQKLMTNYERYGVSLVIVSYAAEEPKKTQDSSLLPEYALYNAIHISMISKNYTITLPDAEPECFQWYCFNGELSGTYVTSVLECRPQDDSIGNEYIRRYSLTERPKYTRSYQKIELPYGIDAKDGAHSLSFENENFATYLVGASRSGKSTLLHTLIAGLIRNYHPDNVELWLADFKQLEFKRYINHLPPHVKYVLLDESTELVYDLIDKLTFEMLERQKLFARLGVQRIDQVDPLSLSKALPVIFVILDEFSIMSQSIAESPEYKLKLQNILAKGAALGIKFLFSSQTFTTGVAGLTSTARAQIQQRIAMKGSKEEISETLELSSNLKTEQVRNWMDALPPHYALVKFRQGADTLPQVKRHLVMYFKDYDVRDQMIDSINTVMHPIEGYMPSDIDAYTDKHPVLVDGNTFEAYPETLFAEKMHSDSEQYSGDEVLSVFGTPRLMEHMKVSALSSETRENILLVGRTAEQACTAAVIMSVIRSFQIQHKKVQIWVYPKNRLYRAYQHVFAACGAEISEGIDAVCNRIRELKQALKDKKPSDQLIVMIGMERICMDFEYVDGTDAGERSVSTFAEKRKKLTESDAVVKTDEQEAAHQKAMAWIKEKRNVKKEGMAAGLSGDALKAFIDERKKEYFSKNDVSLPKENKPMTEKKAETASDAPDMVRKGAYKAGEDFVYILKQGSRTGCHFMLDVNAVGDIKQCGLKPEMFRYKMAFQLSVEDSRTLFNNKCASTLPDHICQFDDTLETYSFRPYLHDGIGWDGWSVENGKVINPYEFDQ